MNRKNPVSEWIGDFAEDVSYGIRTVKIALWIHAKQSAAATGDDSRSLIASRILAAIEARRGCGSRFGDMSDHENFDDLDEWEIEALARFEDGAWTMSEAWEALDGDRREIGLAARRNA